MHAILLVMCVMMTLQGTSAEDTPCDHDFQMIEIPGDCRNPGMRYRECSICGEQVDFENTPALGHDFGEWTTKIPAQCTKEGVEQRTCRRCGIEEERKIAPAGHEYADEVEAATCTKSGRVYKVCQICGDRSITEQLPALGHDYDEGVVTKQPTDRAMGRKTFTCQRCGDTRTETIPRLDKPGNAATEFIEHPEFSANSDTDDGLDRLGSTSSADRSEAITETQKKSGKNRKRSKKRGSSKKKDRQKEFMIQVNHAMAWMEETGISAGIGGGALSADSVCTRAQVILSLWRAAGAPEPNETFCAFEDVSEDDECYQAVLWALENGITFGTDDAHFDPDRNCTRSQVITFLYKSQGSPKCKASERFKDVDREDYYYWPVIWAIQNKMTAGVCRYQFGSRQYCTWGQFATFLYHVYQ